jgi:hypothetical protein
MIQRVTMKTSRTVPGQIVISVFSTNLVLKLILQRKTTIVYRQNIVVSYGMRLFQFQFFHLGIGTGQFIHFSGMWLFKMLLGMLHLAPGDVPNSLTRMETI